MTPGEYEMVTSKIAKSVYDLAQGCNSAEVRCGPTSKWPGESGFAHQIDVAIVGETDIIMVECKHWGSLIKAEHFLTFVARIDDVRRALRGEKKIHPVFVTRKGFQSGCYKLGKFYAIDCELLPSLGNFAMSYKKIRVVGIAAKSDAVALEGFAPIIVESKPPH